MRRVLMPIAAAMVAAAATAAIATAGQDHSGRRDEHRHASYAIGLWGDLPYSDAQRTVGVPNLIADMNGQRLAFTAHDGDINSGGSLCTDDQYASFKASLNTLRAPAMFTPGDNDWTDCDRGPYDANERLAFERITLFDTPYSFGQHKLRLEVQAAPYVENRRWVIGVVYATLNVQGSCNNLCDIKPDAAEFAGRNQADIAWLRATFAEAGRVNAAAVMLIMQADPGWDGSDATRALTVDPASREVFSYQPQIVPANRTAVPAP